MSGVPKTLVLAWRSPRILLVYTKNDPRDRELYPYIDPAPTSCWTAFKDGRRIRTGQRWVRSLIWRDLERSVPFKVYWHCPWSYESRWGKAFTTGDYMSMPFSAPWSGWPQFTSRSYYLGYQKHAVKHARSALFHSPETYQRKIGAEFALVMGCFTTHSGYVCMYLSISRAWCLPLQDLGHWKVLHRKTNMPKYVRTGIGGNW